MKTFESVSLMKNESDAIEAAIRMLKSEFSIVKVILFGSKARGDHDAHSDIDLLVVASKLLHWKEEKAIVGALFDIGMNPLYWRLAQALSALYPSGTDEKRWVDGVLARGKRLGL